MIAFPKDFDISSISRIKGNGSLRNEMTAFSLDMSSRVLTITDVNDDYI